MGQAAWISVLLYSSSGLAQGIELLFALLLQSRCLRKQFIMWDSLKVGQRHFSCFVLRGLISLPLLLEFVAHSVCWVL